MNLSPGEKEILNLIDDKSPIKKARLNKKITQKQLGKRLGISQSCTSKIENGKTKIVSVDKILKISSILSLNPVKIFEFIAEI